MSVYVILGIVLGFLLSRISYNKGYNDGFDDALNYYICIECKGLNSCKNPDSESCKWEP